MRRLWKVITNYDPKQLLCFIVPIFTNRYYQNPSWFLLPFAPFLWSNPKMWFYNTNLTNMFNHNKIKYSTTLCIAFLGIYIGNRLNCHKHRSHLVINIPKVIGMIIKTWYCLKILLKIVWLIYTIHLYIPALFTMIIYWDVLIRRNLKK